MLEEGDNKGNIFVCPQYLLTQRLNAGRPMAKRTTGSFNLFLQANIEKSEDFI